MDDNSINDAYVMNMRLECLKMANSIDKTADEIVKDTHAFFNFLTDDLSDYDEEDGRTN